MTPLRTSLTLMLLVAAVVLAAGCTGEKTPLPLNASNGSSAGSMMPVSPDVSRPIPEGKYLFVKHFVNTGWITVEGTCDSGIPPDNPPLYFLDERTGNLSIHLCPEEQITPALLMFYGGYGSAVPVNSFPRKFWDGVTITEVNSSGFVFINYQNTPVVLKPEEHLVFNRTQILQTSKQRDGQVCTKKIVSTDNFYHEGFFDEEKIHVSYFPQCWPSKRETDPAGFPTTLITSPSP